MALTPVSPSLTNIVAKGFKITVNPDGNPPGTYYAFKVLFNSDIKYVDGTGNLQDTKIYLAVTEITIINAIPNTYHTVTLFAADDAGGTNESSEGPPTSVTTLAADPVAQPYRNIFSTTVTTDWTANENPDGTEYWVELSTDPNFILNVSNSGWITDLGYEFTNLLPSTTYYGRVKARNSVVVETSWISLGSVLTLVGPDVIKQVQVFNLLGERKFLIVWLPSLETNIVNYKVYRSQSPTDGFELITITSPNVISAYDFAPFTFGIVFYWKVTAIDDGGNESSLELTTPAHENTFHSFEEQPFPVSIQTTDVVTGETPQGDVDGINTVFNTNYPYRKGTLVVFSGGVNMYRGLDFTETGSQEFTFTDPPDIGTKIRINYVKF